MANLLGGRARWTRIASELDGRLSLDHRRNASQLLLELFVTVKVFEHRTGTTRRCPRQNINPKGISALDFDSMGSKIVTVTRNGCLSVYDFDTLYCSIYSPTSGILADEVKPRLDISDRRNNFAAVRWSALNQDEVACTSLGRYKVFLYDVNIGLPKPTIILATSSLDQMVKLWDISNNQPSCVASSNPRVGAVLSISFSKDDPFLLAVGGKTGQPWVWDLSSNPGVVRSFGKRKNEKRADLLSVP